MIYYVLRFYSMLGLWFNFRHVYLEHFERKPDHNHIIYGLNHPTAFIDPIALGTHVGAPCWYMLRGDKFVNRPVSWFLHQIKNLPIFRERDGGRAAIRSNIETMSFATDMVLEGESTIILSEGLCKHERRLRKVQRGTARMMFQAWKKDRSKPVCIVPVGANYTAANEFRSMLTLTMGEPIYAADYADAFKEDSRGTIDQVTEELQQRLRQLVVHVEDKSRDELADKLLPLVQHDYPDRGFPPVLREAPFQSSQWQAIEGLNQLDAFAARGLEDELDTYLRQLNQADVTDSGVAFPSYGNLKRAALLWILGPLAALGFLINYPVAAIVQQQAVKRVANPQFFASVRYGLGLGIYFAFLLLAVCVTSILVGWWALCLFVAFPALGYFFLVWFESFKLWREAARTHSLSDGQLERFQQQRRSILAQVGR